MRVNVSPAQIIKTFVMTMLNHPLVVLAAYLTMVFGGAFVYSIFEKVDYWTSLWWAFITVLTIGYGDTYPHTIGGQVTGIVIAHLEIMIIVPIIIGLVIKKILKDENAFTDAEQEQIKAEQKAIMVLVTALCKKNGLDPEAILESAKQAA